MLGLKLRSLVANYRIVLIYIQNFITNLSAKFSKKNILQVEVISLRKNSKYEDWNEARSVKEFYNSLDNGSRD